MGLFGGIYGINGDGKVSCAEKVVSCAYIGGAATRRSRAAAACFATENIYDDCRSVWAAGREREVDDDVFTQVERSVNLIIAGLQEDDLRSMDRPTRRAALEEAGLDPEEYSYLEQ